MESDEAAASENIFLHTASMSVLVSPSAWPFPRLWQSLSPLVSL